MEDVDDIEDLISAVADVAETGREKPRISVTTRIKNKNKKANEIILPSPQVPGTQSIFIRTWGCSHNSSDGEYMAGLLASYGYTITDDKEKADLWILNSCTVKNPAEDHFRNEITDGKKSGKFIVVAGCVPQGDPKSSFIQNLSVIGVQQIDRVIEVVEETLKGHTVRFLGQKKINGKKDGGARLQLPKIRKNKLIEIIAISTGCLNQCTYCKTKHARGNLGSYPPDEIVQRAIESFEEGAVELWLTSEDTGAYGLDIGTNLPELLWRLVAIIPEGCMMRIGMTNPPYILNHLEEIAKILSHPRVYAFLHVPVQAGSNQVLADMKREYSIEEFETVVNFLRQKVPGVSIATDIICGFPTETEEDFAETMRVCEKYKFPSLFINQFYPRKGTPAARMPKIPPDLVKHRTKRLTDLFHSYTTYDHRVGELQNILITEEAKSGTELIGHNKYYEQVLIANRPELMGKFVTVIVRSAKKHCLIADTVQDQTVLKKKNDLNAKLHFIWPVFALIFCILARLFWMLL
ncbi:threonylcarbamoyladenosine tRNA methylthiotransferase [Adelges cooleyi]|uniref:threonylcarbamoyladenosine tRNA methylthiotransferase n=1 Tax=Adelges cooleyi TaxID=133065 RepID=UPI00217FA506|nr:threonylcarbamoyladenosine tRNA methylthiotransferase [Adelges cooleyi]